MSCLHRELEDRLLDIMANPFHVPNASMGQAYYLGPQAMDPRAPTLPAATQFRGHVVSPGMLGVDGLSYHPGIQEGPTMMVSFYYSKY